MATVRGASHTLPNVAVGGGLAYTRELPRRLQLRVEGFAYGQQTRTLANADVARGVKLQLLLAGVGLCPTLWSNAAFGASLCATLQAGVVLFDTFGFQSLQAGTLPMLQGAAGPRLWWQHGRWRLSVGSSLVVSLWRQRLTIGVPAGDDTLLYEAGALSADFDAALGVRF